MLALPGRRQQIHSPPAHLQSRKSGNQHYIKPFCPAPPCLSGQAQMYINQVNAPCYRSPRLFRVPVPVIAPCLLRPQCPAQHSERQECSTYVHKRVGRFQEDVASPEKSCTGHDESTSEYRIREHIYGHVRHEPPALKGRHQGLVMNLRLEYVQADKHGRHHEGKCRNPPVSPTHICQQGREHHEEGIP